MTNKEMVKRIQSVWNEAEVSAKYKHEIEVKNKSATIEGLLTVLKSLGFNHLSNITCVDWIDDNRFDVTYNLWSYEHKLHVIVKLPIDREHPEVATSLEIWPSAQVYEQEIHEMFGVKFLGNPDLSPLFLHNWQDIPPLRKDFDTEKYAIKAFGAKRNKQD